MAAKKKPCSPKAGSKADKRKVKCRGANQSAKCRAMFASMNNTGTYRPKKACRRK
jgi:hypothetical protein